MRLDIAEFTIATHDVARLKGFYAGLIGEKAEVEDHDFSFKIKDPGQEVCISVVPHDGDQKWDKPSITFGTDDMPGALERLREMGAQDIENSGPTDENGNPTACVTFRDPDGRLMMLATY